MNTIKSIYATEQPCQVVSSNEWLTPWPQADREYIWTYPLLQGGAFDPVDVLKPAVVPCPSDALAIYVHVPACLFHCPMCPFYHEIVKDRSSLHGYEMVVAKEIETYAQAGVLDDKSLSAIYFGGGTASLLEPEAIERLIQSILALFPNTTRPEITVECHPRTVDKKYLGAIAEKGVNRVSFGIQSFNDKFLKSLGLRQREENSREILSAAVKLPFDTVSMDLIYRIPGQTVEDVIMDLDSALELGVTSISTYSLELSVQQTRFKHAQPDDHADREMFYSIEEKLIGQNWVHHAQPDYAAPGHEHHELDVSWTAPQGHVLGLGAGAWSVFNGRTFYNTHDIERYSVRVKARQLPISNGQTFTLDDALTRYPVLGARTFDIPAEPFEQSFGLSFFDTFALEIAQLESKGLISCTDIGLHVTRKGKYFVDSISKHFYSHANRNRLQPWGARLSALEAGTSNALEEVSESFVHRNRKREEI